MSYTEDINKIVESKSEFDQLTKLAEECVELADAAFKLKKSLSNSAKGYWNARDHLIEEMADVQVLMDQMKVYCEITDEDIEKVKFQKAHRVIERMAV